jgi:hypothetical protein
LQGGLLVSFFEIDGKMPASKPAAKKAITLRLPSDLIVDIEREAISDGQNRAAGRVYSPSATVERILRAYFKSNIHRKPRA